MSARLRIAVYHNLPSGGAKRALFDTVLRLAQKHHVDLFTLSCSENEFCDIRPFVNSVITFPFNPWSSSFFNSPLGRLNRGVELSNLLRLRKLSREISRQIDKGSYDVVYVHHCKFTQSPSILEFLSTPSVYYCQESIRWMYEPKIPRPYLRQASGRNLYDGFDLLKKYYVTTLRRLDQLNVKRANLVLVNSYFSRESIYRIYGINARVCYPGVDTDYFKPLELMKENIVLSVGSVTPAKGNDLIIKGLAYVPQEIRPAFVLAYHAWNEEERSYLEALSVEKGINLIFYNAVENDRLVELYNTARLTAFTPYLEPFGLVPLESMACGTAVIGVREGGLRETILDGKTGRLVNRDPESFGQTIVSLLEERDLIRNYGLKGREYVINSWNWQRTVDELEISLYQLAKSS